MAVPLPLSGQRERYSAARLSALGLSERQVADRLQEMYSIRERSTAEEYASYGARGARAAAAVGDLNERSFAQYKRRIDPTPGGTYVVTARLSFETGFTDPETGRPIMGYRDIQIQVDSDSTASQIQDRVATVQAAYERKYVGRNYSIEWVSIIGR